MFPEIYSCVEQAHMHNLWRGENDPLRCDWARRQAREANAEEANTANAVITRPLVLASHQDLARREPADCEFARETRLSYCIEVSTNLRQLQEEWSQARDMTRIQDYWREHLANIKSKCSLQFWEIFLRIHTYSGVAIDTSLSAVRKVFLRKGTDAWNEFPPTRRVLLDKIRSHDSFWNKVWHRQRIDLRAFKLH